MSLIRNLCRTVLAGLVLTVCASPVAAQFRPAADPATGERYHIEAAAVWWGATPTLVVRSEALGIEGTDVDLVADLGIEKKTLREVRLVLRPARKHKFRFSYIPIKYTAESTVQREFIFNGLRYNIGLPVQTSADLSTFRAGYEYDFIYRDRGYAGVMIDLKYTNVDVRLDSLIGSEFVKSVAPIPAIGFVGRGYIVPNISITGEVSFFKVPDNLGGGEFGGRYIDVDFYATVNFNDYIGAQAGYRSIDVNYFSEADNGKLTFKGPYFGGVIRY